MVSWSAWLLLPLAATVSANEPAEITSIDAQPLLALELSTPDCQRQPGALPCTAKLAPSDARGGRTSCPGTAACDARDATSWEVPFDGLSVVEQAVLVLWQCPRGYEQDDDRRARCDAQLRWVVGPPTVSYAARAEQLCALVRQWAPKYDAPTDHPERARWVEHYYHHCSGHS